MIMLWCVCIITVVLLGGAGRGFNFHFIRYLGREKNNNKYKNKMTQTEKKLTSPSTYHFYCNNRVRSL